MEVYQSRNLLVASAFLFLFVVVALRFAGGLFEANVEGLVGTIFGGYAESVPLIEVAAIDLTSLNPATWSVDAIKTSTNKWFHDMVDTVLPAFIYSLNTAALFAVASIRLELMGAGLKLAKISPFL